MCNIELILLLRLALLVCNCAGGLAGRLAGTLALAAAALYSGSFQISLVNGCDVLQVVHLFRKFITGNYPVIVFSISYFAFFFK